MERPKDKSVRLFVNDSEIKKLERDMALSDTEKFYKMVEMIRLHFMLKNATVTHQPENNGYSG